MFNFFNKKKGPPIPDWDKNWMEDSFKWLCNELDLNLAARQRVLLPTQENFPIDLPLNDKNVTEVLKIIAQRMGVDPCQIELQLIDRGPKVFNSENGFPIYSQIEEGEINYGGAYLGINPDGKFLIQLDNQQLKVFQWTVATLAHEISHVILSELMKMEDYDEYLTELLTVFNGLGIFSANSSFQFDKTFDSWEYNKQGYLNQQEWAYALALFASIRHEENPAWSEYLEKGILIDFKKSQIFIRKNLPANWFLYPPTQV